MIHIAQYITDLLASETPWMNTTTVCTYPYPWRNDSSDIDEELVSHPLPNAPSYYTGTYVHPAFGEIIITEHHSQDKLKMKMGLYLDADLSYNSKKDSFYTTLTNKYWYMDDKIPIQFRNLEKVGIANTFSTILMPLTQPYESANKLTFKKDLDEYVLLHTTEILGNNALGLHNTNFLSCIKAILFPIICVVSH